MSFEVGSEETENWQNEPNWDLVEKTVGYPTDRRANCFAPRCRFKHLAGCFFKGVFWIPRNRLRKNHHSAWRNCKLAGMLSCRQSTKPAGVPGRSETNMPPPMADWPLDQFGLADVSPHSARKSAPSSPRKRGEVKRRRFALLPSRLRQKTTASARGAGGGRVVHRIAPRFTI
jgi:hypothetical protein